MSKTLSLPAAQNPTEQNSPCLSGGLPGWLRDKLPTPVYLGFPCGSAGKESTCNVGDLGSIPG